MSACTHTLEMAFSILQLVLCSKIVIKIATWQQLLAHVDVINILCSFTAKLNPKHCHSSGPTPGAGTGEGLSGTKVICKLQGSNTYGVN